MHLKLKFLNQGQGEDEINKQRWPAMVVVLCGSKTRNIKCPFQTGKRKQKGRGEKWRGRADGMEYAFLAYWYETRHYCVKIIKFLPSYGRCLSPSCACVGVCVCGWMHACGDLYVGIPCLYFKPILCMLLHGHQNSPTTWNVHFCPANNISHWHLPWHCRHMHIQMRALSHSLSLSQTILAICMAKICTLTHTCIQMKLVTLI